MTNFEQWKGMSESEALQFFEELFKSPFTNYIDKKAYLESEDNDIKHFIQYEAYAVVPPSEAELLSQQFNTETERMIYTKQHTKKMPVLQKTTMFGAEYVILADTENNMICKVPASNVFIFNGKIKQPA